MVKEVFCKTCGTKHLVSQEQIFIVPVGYKGKVKCYITCSECQKEIIIPNTMVNSKKIAKVIEEN